MSAIKVFRIDAVHLHPLLFAVFPVFFIYSRHSDLFSLGVIVEPIIIFSLPALALLIILRRIARNFGMASVITSLAVIFFFSYAEARRFFDMNLIHVGEFVILFDRLFFYGYLLLFCVICLLILRIRGEFKALNQFFCIVAFFCVGVEAIKTGWAEFNKTIAKSISAGAPGTDGKKAASGTYPNIIYIILDGYGRSDVLREYYGHDNELFLGKLKSFGFFVAGESRANYSQTNLSLASSLNFAYLDDVVAKMGPQTRNRDILTQMIRESEVMRVVREHGYRFVSFSSGVFATEFPNADVYLGAWWDRGEFASALFGMTPILTVIGMLSTKGGDDWSKAHRERVTYILGRLPSAASAAGPLLVFAHILSPHPPFVFDAQGNAITVKGLDTELDGNYVIGEKGVARELYVKHYADQLQYLNTRILKIVDSVISKSKTPPVIIIQGDHGPGSRLDQDTALNSDAWERMGILNAYYFPDHDYSILYAGISPVNSFRAVFKKVFEDEHKFLADESFMSPFKRPYEVHRVDPATLAYRPAARAQ